MLHLRFKPDENHKLPQRVNALAQVAPETMKHPWQTIHSMSVYDSFALPTSREIWAGW